MLSGVRPIHPEIVGWSTAPRGQVTMRVLGQVPKKLVSWPARAGKDRIITDPIGYETGWAIARSLGEVGTNSVHSNPVFACNDCTFFDELHRATLEKNVRTYVGVSGNACTASVCPGQTDASQCPRFLRSEVPSRRDIISEYRRQQTNRSNFFIIESPATRPYFNVKPLRCRRPL